MALPWIESVTVVMSIITAQILNFVYSAITQKKKKHDCFLS